MMVWALPHFQAALRSLVLLAKGWEALHSLFEAMHGLFVRVLPLVGTLAGVIAGALGVLIYVALASQGLSRRECLTLVLALQCCAWWVPVAKASSTSSFEVRLKGQDEGAKLKEAAKQRPMLRSASAADAMLSHASPTRSPTPLPHTSPKQADLSLVVVFLFL